MSALGNNIFRYQIIMSTDAQSLNKKHVTFTICVTISILFYMGVFLGITTLYDVPSIALVEVCVNGPNARETSPLVVMPMIVNLVTTLLPAFYDWKTYRHISIRTSPSVTEEQPASASSNMLDVPFRATLLSTASALSFLFVAAIITQLSHLEGVKEYVLSVISIFLVGFRHPLVAAITFKQNQANMAINQEQIREAKRRIEIEHAMMNRKQKSNNVPMTQIISLPNVPTIVIAETDPSCRRRESSVASA